MVLPVNVNTASFEELQTLYEVGSKRADLIIRTREKKKFLTAQFLRDWTEFPAGFWAHRLDAGEVIVGDPSLSHSVGVSACDSDGPSSPMEGPTPQLGFSPSAMQSGDCSSPSLQEKPPAWAFMILNVISESQDRQEEFQKQQAAFQQQMVELTGRLTDAALRDVGRQEATSMRVKREQLPDTEPSLPVQQMPQTEKDPPQRIIVHPAPDLQGAVGGKTLEQIKLEQAADLKNKLHETAARPKTKAPAQATKANQKNIVPSYDPIGYTTPLRDDAAPLHEFPVSEHPRAFSVHDPMRMRDAPAGNGNRHQTARRGLYHAAEDFGVRRDRRDQRDPDHVSRRYVTVPNPVLMHDDLVPSVSESEQDDDDGLEPVVPVLPARNHPRPRGRVEARQEHVRGPQQGNPQPRELPALPKPKLPIFEGKTDSVVDWRAYISQFRRIAIRHRWNDEEKLDRLVECLRDKALVFFSRLEAADQNSFDRLCNQLAMRFQKEETPAVLLKRLQEVKQEIEEPVEEFASRAQQLAQDAFPQFGHAVVQPMAVDAFLRGCRDKLPAFSVMNQGPATIQEALRLLRKAQSNQMAIFGLGQPKVRQLRFQDELTEELPQVRAIQPDVEHRVKKTEGEMNAIKAQLSEIKEQLKRTSMTSTDRLDELKAMIQRSMINTNSGSKMGIVCFRCKKAGHTSRECQESSDRSRSPSPANRSGWQTDATCFNCHKTGHFSRQCPERKGSRSRSPSPRLSEN